jgi:hypothetical protein
MDITKSLPKKGDRIIYEGNLQPYARALVLECVPLPDGRTAIVLEWPDAPGEGAKLSRVYLHDEGKVWYRYGQNN